MIQSRFHDLLTHPQYRGGGPTALLAFDTSTTREARDVAIPTIPRPSATDVVSAKNCSATGLIRTRFKPLTASRKLVTSRASIAEDARALPNKTPSRGPHCGPDA